MNDSQKITFYQVVMILMILVISILSILVVYERAQHNNAVLEKQMAINRSREVLKIFDLCTPEKGYDYIDTVRVKEDGNICYNCNQLLSFQDGIIQAKTAEVCSG